MSGHAGAQGSTSAGVAGPAGLAGARGPRGSKGEIGSHGRVGDLDCWTSYREFWFEHDSAAMQDSEQDKLAEVAAYMKRSPSLQIGIDGFTDSRGMDQQSRQLNETRVKTIRDALIAAGVPAEKISVGDYGDDNLRRDRRVEVLIATAN